MMADTDSIAPTRLRSYDHTECEEVSLEVYRLRFGSRESHVHGSYLLVYKASCNYLEHGRRLRAVNRVVY